MSKRFAVIGLGIFGWKVAISLAEMGAEVIAIDKDIEQIDKIKEHVLVAVQLNSTDQKSLEMQDLKNIDAAIVGIGQNFEENLLTVVALKQMGVPKVIARAGTPVRRKILEEMGCDMVVLPEEDMGRRVAKTLVSGLFLDRIEVGDQHSIVDFPAPSDLIGTKIIDSHLREDHHVTIVTIKSPTTTAKKVVKSIDPADEIREGDVLVLFGHDDDLDELAETFEKKAQEENTERRIAKMLASDLHLKPNEADEPCSLVQFPAPPDLVGKTISDSRLPEQYHVSIVGIRSQVTTKPLLGKETTKEVIKAVPNPHDEIQQDDVLVLFGQDDALEKFAKDFEKPKDVEKPENGE